MYTEGNITAYQMETLYKIMLKRIGKGISPDGLSFLIGRENRYVEAVETLNAPFYSAEDLQKIAIALEERSVADIVAVADNTELIKTEVKYYEELHIHYMEYTSIDEHGHRFREFLLKENVRGVEEMNTANCDCRTILSRIIRIMVAADFFLKKRNPLEIYLAIKPLMTYGYMKTEILRAALDEHSEPDADYYLLKKVKCKGFSEGYVALPLHQRTSYYHDEEEY